MSQEKVQQALERLGSKPSTKPPISHVMRALTGRQITEATLNRVLLHVKRHGYFVIASPDRWERSYDENQMHWHDMSEWLQQQGMSFIKVRGYYLDKKAPERSVPWRTKEPKPLTVATDYRVIQNDKNQIVFVGKADDPKQTVAAQSYYQKYNRPKSPLKMSRKTYSVGDKPPVVGKDKVEDHAAIISDLTAAEIDLLGEYFADFHEQESILWGNLDLPEGDDRRGVWLRFRSGEDVRLGNDLTAQNIDNVWTRWRGDRFMVESIYYAPASMGTTYLWQRLLWEVYEHAQLERLIDGLLEPKTKWSITPEIVRNWPAHRNEAYYADMPPNIVELLEKAYKKLNE